MHVSEYFYGTYNDKQITVNDTFPVDVWQGDLFKLKRYTLINKHGVAIEYQGVWLAVDGGILKIRFRFLRGFVVYHDPSIIENAFKTAAMLHNMDQDLDFLK